MLAMIDVIGATVVSTCRRPPAAGPGRGVPVSVASAGQLNVATFAKAATARGCPPRSSCPCRHSSPRRGPRPPWRPRPVFGVVSCPWNPHSRLIYGVATATRVHLVRAPGRIGWVVRPMRSSAAPGRFAGRPADRDRQGAGRGAPAADLHVVGLAGRSAERHQRGATTCRVIAARIGHRRQATQRGTAVHGEHGVESLPSVLIVITPVVAAVRRSQ